MDGGAFCTRAQHNAHPPQCPSPQQHLCTLACCGGFCCKGHMLCCTMPISQQHSGTVSSMCSAPSLTCCHMSASTPAASCTGHQLTGLQASTLRTTCQPDCLHAPHAIPALAQHSCHQWGHSRLGIPTSSAGCCRPLSSPWQPSLTPLAFSLQASTFLTRQTPM